MISTEPTTTKLSLLAEGTLRRVRYVPQAAPGQETLLAFRDPAACVAVCVLNDDEAKPGYGIDVLVVPRQPNEQLGSSDELMKWVADGSEAGSAPPVAITLHGAQVVWTPARAAVLAAPDRVQSFFLALVDFCHHEGELRKLEREVADSWQQMDHDAPQAHQVASYDPELFDQVGQRVELTLRRRMRLARIGPRFTQPRPTLPLLANQLVERLREKAHTEARLEALAAQLEVFERFHETCSQRIADYKAARQERTLEWVIIVLLAAETILLLIDLLWTMGV